MTALLSGIVAVLFLLGCAVSFFLNIRAGNVDGALAAGVVPVIFVIAGALLEAVWFLARGKRWP
jgi:hypothetical protein